MRLFPLLFILAASAGCDALPRPGPPETPKNLSAKYTKDISGDEAVRLEWETEDPLGDDLFFKIHRNGVKIDAAYSDMFCTVFSEDHECISYVKPFYFDYKVARGETYCYAVSACLNYWGCSEASQQTCLTIPVEGSGRFP